MNPDNFVPQLFIGIGEKSCFFTLRQTYLAVVHVPGDGPMGNAVVNGVYQGSTIYEVRSHHLCNLSQDPDEAIEKATAASHASGTQLTTTREKLVDELNEIKRSTAAEIERREREQRERQERWEAERKAENEAMIAQLDIEGIVPIGAFRGRKVSELPRSYATWLAKSVDEFEYWTPIWALATHVIQRHPELILPEPDVDAFCGEEGKRSDFELLVLRRFTHYGEYGTSFILTMMDVKTKACVMSFSSAFDADVGEQLKVKATVKSHSRYKGQAQTTIQRIKVLA